MVIKKTLASLKIQGTILNFRYRFSYIKPTLDYRYDVRAITLLKKKSVLYWKIFVVRTVLLNCIGG